MNANDASGSNRDPELNMGLPRDERRIRDSMDGGQSTEDATTIFSHSTPSRATIRASSLMVSGESPGFLDNPVYPLNSAAPRQMIPSLYDITIKEAPSFATNPAYPLNYVALGQISAPSRKAATAEAPSFATDLAYPPSYVASGQTLPSLYNASTAEAPSFVASPAYSLNYASTPSLYNALDEEAPILSNKVFGSVHPFLCNTASWGTSVFSDRWGHS
ncbi:MAG: hypothetical protein M1812_005843 [Candelaria pacifica]|nr:MAG: hypothetical protein M1812_005843 [Candelaria pacifica]